MGLTAMRHGACPRSDVEKQQDALMRIRLVDCPEIYNYLRHVDLSGLDALELGCETGIDSRLLLELGRILHLLTIAKLALLWRLNI